MKSIIVTGGAGFIGSNIVKYLYSLGKNYTIHIFDNLSTGRVENILIDKNIIFHEIDLRSNISQWPQINAIEIYHFAANADVRGGESNRNIDLEQNLLVTKSVCDYAVFNKIKKLIFASSATVYGEPKIFPTPEETSASQTSVYGASKLAAESFIQAYSEYGEFESYIFRFVSWTGIGYSHGVIYDFVNKLLKDPTRLEILGDGKQTKSYLDVSDGIRGVFNLSRTSDKKTNTFNLGHHQTMNVIDLAKIVTKQMQLENVDFIFTGGSRGWIGDSPFVHLDTKLANDNGWIPEISIDESIIRTVKYLLEDKKRLFR